MPTLHQKFHTEPRLTTKEKLAWAIASLPFAALLALAFWGEWIFK